MKRQLTLCLALTLAAVIAPNVARAQAPEGDGGAAASDPQQEINDAVAHHLYERGRHLFASGDITNAKQMFIESLERSADGPVSDDALAMLRSSNERLGLALDDGVPDPDAGDAVADGPVDPYGDGDRTADATPVDPYGDGADDPEKPIPDDDELTAADKRASRRTLMLHAGALGFTTGFAIAGPEDGDGDIGGGAILGGVLTAGVGVGATYFLVRNRDISRPDARAISSGGVWTGALFGLLADAVTGTDDTEPNEVWRGAAVGGVVGTGLGVVYALKGEPSSGDLAMVNSVTAMGAVEGLAIAFLMAPPETEAYSLNTVFGIVGGAGLGLLAARKWDVSRKRMVRIDLAGFGAAAIPWALLYPFIEDGSTSGDERAAGALSALTLIGGTAFGWWLTRDLDDEDENPLSGQPAISGLISRDPDGAWGIGALGLRPPSNPTLAAGERPNGAVIDLFGGSF